MIYLCSVLIPRVFPLSNKSFLSYLIISKGSLHDSSMSQLQDKNTFSSALTLVHFNWNYKIIFTLV